MKTNAFLRPAAALCITVGCAAPTLSVARAADPPKAAPPAGQSAAPAANPPAAPSDTTMAERTIRVTWSREQGVRPPDVRAVVGRLETSDVAGKIGSELLGLPPDVAAATIQATEARTSGDGIEVDLTVLLDPIQFPKAKPRAKEFADQLVTTFHKMLADERDAQESPRLAQAKEWLLKVEVDYADLSKRVKEQQAEMGGHSPEGARAALGKLEDERQRLELELAGMQARQKAVEEWIARTSNEMREAANTDPIIAELEKAQAAQERVVEVARRQFESGTISQSAVADAESKLSDVKIQLLERKRAGGATGGPGGTTDPLTALNRELQTISIDIVDRKARLAFIEKRTDRVRNAAAMAADYEILEAERATLRKELESARRELRMVQRTTQGPAVRDRVAVIRARNGKHQQ